MMKTGTSQFIGSISMTDRFKELTDMMVTTHERKNHDYGDSFNKTLDKYGLIASLVRMEDKFNRIESLKDKEPKVVNESLKDTLLDLANYCLMTVMWIMKEEDKNKSKSI